MLKIIACPALGLQPAKTVTWIPHILYGLRGIVVTSFELALSNTLSCSWHEEECLVRNSYI